MSEKFELVKKGYDPKEVDVYIRALEVELRSYKDRDEVIRNAIVSAQQAADNIIQNAKNQARHMRENTAKQLEDISISIAAQRQMLSAFVREYEVLVSKYLKPIDNADFAAIYSKIDSLESYLKGFSEEVAEDIEIAKSIPEDAPVQEGDE